MRPFTFAVVAATGLLALASTAAAQTPGDDAPFDVRARERAAVETTGSAPARRPSAAMRRARTDLRRALGDQGVLEVDPLTGTPRVLARLDGTLTRPRAGDAVAIAERYVRENVAALGLTTADLDALGAARREPLPGGGVQVRWRQAHHGVPALDSELRVTVTGDGAVLNVLGAPQHDLEPTLDAPRIGAAAALREAGASAAPRTLSSDAGAERTTRFAGGDRASLVVFGEGDSARLAWSVLHHESSTAIWHAVVDAGSGRVLKRSNLVKSIEAQVYERHPGHDPITVDLGPWLGNSTASLFGSNAVAWSDVDGDDVRDADENVVPGEHPLQPFSGSDCSAPRPCTWDSAVASSWDVNRAQTTQQAFYYVNRFHDWLGELGFGGFGGRLQVQTLDGAGTQAPAYNNANMYTPPAGSPVMQLYLFKAPQGRNVSGSDDAAIVYHEYAHGLTDRLVTTADGTSALNTPQAAAMGEGFSDFFAMDYLDETGPQEDGPGAGDFDVGEYVDGATPLRLQAIDCPVDVVADRCGEGGLTYDRFGQLVVHDGQGVPDVHADGEIWAQTLWDLRTALGAGAARQVVLAALPLAPAEPSFLDMRNAILQAADAGQRDAVWEVFRNRGMGFYASTSGSSDIRPIASTGTPNGPADKFIGGTVTDFDNGRPIAGATVRVGGNAFSATTGGDGAFLLKDLPAGTYGDVTFSANGGHDPLTRSLTAPASGVAVQLRRNWAAKASGASIASVGGVVNETAGCTADEAIDQNADTGFSVVHDSSAPAIIVRLPRLVSVAEFAVNTGNTCGDGFEATTTRFAIAVSENGSTWREVPYALPASAAHTRTALAPGAAAGRANYVRLRLLETADASSYIDFSELSVYGNALPVVALATPASGRVGQAVTLSAAGGFDPDGAIVGYAWDFDGNGTIDRNTATPTTSYAYGRAGSFRATVTAVDNKGGRNGSARTIAITAPPAPPAPPPPTPPNPPAPPPIAAPVVELPASGTRGRLSLRVTCGIACSGTAKLTVDRRTARKLRLGRTRTVATATIRLTAAGTRRVTVRLTSKARRALVRWRVRTLRGRLTVAVTDTGGRATSGRRTVRVRR